MGSRLKVTFRMERKQLIIVTSVVAVLCIILIGWTISLQFANKDPAVDIDAEKATAEVKRAEADGKLRDDASAQIKENQAGSAARLYQEAIDAEQTTERKTRLYIDLSGVYYAAGRSEEALEAATKAESVNPDKFLVADWLSRIYEDKKDYKKAAEYYRLAGEWAGSDQNKTALDKKYFDDKAAEMKRLSEGATS